MGWGCGCQRGKDDRAGDYQCSWRTVRDPSRYGESTEQGLGEGEVSTSMSLLKTIYGTSGLIRLTHFRISWALHLGTRLRPVKVDVFTVNVHQAGLSLVLN